MNRPVPAIVAIGASTGGPPALLDVLSHLPAQLPVGVLVVQHMPEDFTANFVQRMNAQCELRIREASEGDAVQPGTVLVAPAGLHMTVGRGERALCVTRLSKLPTGTLHTPSVDILMCSVAATFRQRAMGILLTGMGSDGARGMKAIHDAGGWTVGQDAGSSAVYGMPRAAAHIGALHRVVPLNQISTEILAAVWGKCDALTPRVSSHAAH